MKTCKNCEKEIANNAKICRFCWNHTKKAELVWKKTGEKKQDFFTLEEINEWWLWFKAKKNLKWHVFWYDENQIFYKNHTPTVSSYYWRRILLVIILIVFGVIPWLLVLAALFSTVKPRNRCLLISKEWIGVIDKQKSFSFSKWRFLNKENIGEIIIKRDSIYIKKVGKPKNYFVFDHILEVERLKYSLKYHGYKFL